MNNLYTNLNNDDFFYPVSSCKECPKLGTNACNTCARKRTEPRKKSECHTCNDKVQLKECNCKNTTVPTCKTTRSVCPSDHFAVKNYFSELIHDWERDLAKYNLGIQELESINYITEEVEEGSYLNKVLFVFRRGHELITKEFLVSPKGRDGKDGKPFEWKDLTDKQKLELTGEKGDKGDPGVTPSLRSVIVSYTDQPCGTGGYFAAAGDNNYDLYLTLPKQPNLLDCLREIQTLISSTINEQIALLSLRITNLENSGNLRIDFGKLSLELNNNLLILKYDGSTIDSVLLNLLQDQYSLRHHQEGDKWQDTLQLLKNQQVVSSIPFALRLKPKEWNILSYPMVILLKNGILQTKKLRISAWYSNNGVVTDMTEEYNKTNHKDLNFLLSLQTTSSYFFNDDSTVDGEWETINDGSTYNEKTGILTLPENYSIKDTNKTIDGITYHHCQYVYRTGDFIIARLYAQDSINKILYIPVIDIDALPIDVNSNGTVFYTNRDPRTIGDEIEYAIINYTHTYRFDLRNYQIYDSEGVLINSIIEVNPSTFLWKNLGGKKYFLGSFTKVTDSGGSTLPTNTLYVSRFRLVGITHGATKTNTTISTFKLKFKYLDHTTNLLRDLTEDEMCAFSAYWSAHVEDQFNNILGLKKYSNTGVGNTMYFLDFVGVGASNSTLIYSYADLNITNTGNNGMAAGGRAHGTSNTLLTNYKLHVKSNAQYAIYLDINVDIDSSNLLFKLVQPLSNISVYGEYLDKFNLDIMSTINNTIDVNSYIVESITPAEGVTYSNGMFFYNGLFVAENELDGDPVISERGDYAYVIGDDSVQILNLTNMPLAVEIEGITYELAPHEKYIDEEAPIGDPVNH